MTYYRTGYTSFREFQRESFHVSEELGKDELELLLELDAVDERVERGVRPRRPQRRCA